MTTSYREAHEIQEELSYHKIENSSAIKEHRINMIQVGVSLMPAPSGGLPSILCPAANHVNKLKSALTLALQDNWANVVVFPEISVPVESLQELMTLSYDKINSRPKEAGWCLVCLPIEHLPLSKFEELVDELTEHECFIAGDNSLNKENVCGHLLEEIPKTDQSDAFVNVSVLLAFSQPGSDEKGCYFFQPKRFPYPGERTPKSGRFVRGARSYLLEIGGINFLTSICFDFIAQPPGKGTFLSDLIQKIQETFGNLDYLLLPQCNDDPLNVNFNRAIVDLYHRSQEKRKTMRVLSPNVAYITMLDSQTEASHSWFITCPFGHALPPLGIIDKNLISSFKNPSTNEIIIDAPALGHYARRLRLSANGEWLLNLSLPPAEDLLMCEGPTAPLPPHRGEVYEWRDSKWQKKDAELFQRDCRYAERFPGLHVLVELAKWVQENIGGRNTYTPSYAEFTDERVCLPKDDQKKVLSLVNESNDVLIKGEKACGKTVFGLSIAFDWISNMNGKCLFFDFKDLELDEMQFIEDAKKDIEWVLNIHNPLLIVLDNVHTNDAVAQKLLKHIQELRGTGQQVQALLIGRDSQEHPTERVTLLDNELLVPIELKATEEAFICVAMRLSQRNGISCNYTSPQAKKWIRECGDDLIVFATTFDPLRPDALDQASISNMVRRRYIIPAETQEGGRDAFFDLCALSSLDINTEDSKIWGQYVEVLFPQFIEDGTVLRVPMITGNPRAYCRLFHPSLGELILRVENHFSSRATQKFWIGRALDLCHRHPFLVPLIYYRLASGRYGNVADFNQWCEKVNNESGLIERAVCHDPGYTVRMLRRGELNFSWDRLQELPTSEGYDVLLESLAWTSAGVVVLFLKYLDDLELQKESQDILTELLKNEEFKTRLARTPPDNVVSFLKYLDDRRLQPKIQDIFTELMKNEEFKTRFAWTSAGVVVLFLKYLDDLELQKESQDILTELLKNEEFKTRLARTPPDNVVSFLKYLDDRRLQPKIQDIFTELMKNEEFKTRFAWTSAGVVVLFLKYLDDLELQKESQDILTELLKNEEFKTRLARTPPDNVVSFLKYLDDLELQKESQDILTELLENEEFKTRLARTPPDNVVSFLKYLDDLELQKESQDILTELLENEEFEEKLFSSPPDAQGALLAYLSGTGNREFAQKMLDNTWNRLDLASFEHHISRWHSNNLAGFRGAIRNSRLSIASELWTALIKKIKSSPYIPPIPDPDYPQDMLLNKTVYELTGLLTHLNRTTRRYKLNCVFKSLIVDEKKLQTWIKSLSPQDVTLFHETVVELRLNIPPDSWELLSASTHNTSAGTNPES
ncbi:MAG: hypothetical protein AEth_01858 [Candidatus Argoarchaeum ethanivorans]|uniref:Uncharacterized protein n=1 Tax=Candidatus Argoarchaeum ethanivorans TaxID=2608793 RepID=A0A8B3RZV1_9EURY|nr:MAG: hypothetical protein AEth_01858 [Candidatus Argoarchaeum ethanivorans]